MIFSLIYIKAKFTLNKRFDIICIETYPKLKSLKLGMGIAYAKYDVYTFKDKQKNSAVLYSSWHGEGELIIIVPQKDLWKGHFYFHKSKLRELFKKYSQIENLRDYSIELSKYHILESLPKNYRLLKPGEIVKRTDIEYNTFSCSGGKYWSKIVSHYNIGAKVEKELGICIINQKGKKTHLKGLIKPLIARRITA